METIVFDTQLKLKDNGNKGILYTILTPWEASPFQLISWFNMEQFSALLFYQISTMLEQLKREFIWRSDLKNLESLPEHINIRSSDRTRLREILELIDRSCQQIGLRNSAGATREFIEELTDEKTQISPSDVSKRVEEIDRAIRREMNLHLFMYIPIDRAEYCRSWGESRRAERKEEIPLFGNIVKEKFPSTDYEITEAGNCFSVGRYTACVFHLMRVLEIGLILLAKKFNIPSDHTNWNPMIEGVEKAIRNMANDPNKLSNWKEEREFYAQVVNLLALVKDGWRNYTAHARGKYDDEEAEVIMINVRAFMQKLATKLSE